MRNIHLIVRYKQQAHRRALLKYSAYLGAMASTFEFK
jgi:hypothetical protein